MLSATAVPIRRRNDDESVVSAVTTPDQREGVSRQTPGCSRQRGSKGAETSCRSSQVTIYTSRMGTRGSWWAHRAHQRPAVVRGRSPRTQKSQPLCELVSTGADTAFGEEGCDDNLLTSLPDDPTERALASEGDERGGEAPERVPCFFISSHYFQIMSCISFRIAFQAQLRQCNGAYSSNGAHLAWFFSLFHLMRFHLVTSESNCLSLAK